MLNISKMLTLFELRKNVLKFRFLSEGVVLHFEFLFHSRKKIKNYIPYPF